MIYIINSIYTKLDIRSSGKLSRHHRSFINLRMCSVHFVFELLYIYHMQLHYIVQECRIYIQEILHSI